MSNAGFFFNNVGPSQTAPLNYLSQPFQAGGQTNTFPSQPPASNYDFSPVLPINSTGFVYLDDPHLRTPYIYQYNLSLQQNLVSDMVLEANYVGTSAHGLTSLKDINPMVLGTTSRALDSSCAGCFGQLPEFQNVSYANYNALEASLTRQPKGSKLGTVYFTLAYTYAHNLDNASGFRQRNSTVPAYAPDFFYASGDSDVRHRISFSGGWDLPFDRMWATGPKRLTNGWSLYPIVTWRTGFPFDIPARLGGSVDPTNPGTSGAGDPYLSNAAVVAPIRMLDPRHLTTITPTIYGSDASGNCLITGGAPITGHFIFDPNSFSNIPLAERCLLRGHQSVFPAAGSGKQSGGPHLRTASQFAARAARGERRHRSGEDYGNHRAHQPGVPRGIFQCAESSRVRAAHGSRRSG